MRRMIFLLAIFNCGLCIEAKAELIPARETVIGSGFFDGNPFTNALVELTGTYDTATITSNPFFAEAYEVTTVTVGSVSDTLTGGATAPNGEVFLASEPHVFSTPGRSVGFSTSSADILDTRTTANAGYFLQGPFGPYSGPPIIDAFWKFSTSSGGYFELISTSSNATVGASNASSVPEPGSLTLACLGAFGAVVGAFYHRRR